MDIQHIHSKIRNSLQRSSRFLLLMEQLLQKEVVLGIALQKWHRWMEKFH